MSLKLSTIEYCNKQPCPNNAILHAAITLQRARPKSPVKQALSSPYL